MKIFILSILFPFLLITGCFSAFSQQTKPKTLTHLEENTIEPTKPVDLSQFKNWQKVEMVAYSFYAPSDFKLTKLRGVDATIWEYKSDEIHLIILAGNSVDLYIPPKSHSNDIKFKTLWIEEVPAKMMTYEQIGKEHKYISAIRFIPPEQKIARVLITIDSKDSNGQELAKKIFESIRFRSVS